MPGENVQRWLNENFVPADDKYVRDLDLMRLGYVTALLWSEYDTETDDEGHDVDTPLEEMFETYELPAEFTKRCREEVLKFVEAIRPSEIWRLDPDLAGHDLWLTRQHTGAGFGDGDWNALTGDRYADKLLLAIVSLLFPHETLVYIGDDGELYFG